MWFQPNRASLIRLLRIDRVQSPTVLQIGADVWCDTGIIIRKIDELKPEPTIYPGGLTAAADTMNQWADRRLFWSTTPVKRPDIRSLLESR